MYMFLQNSIKLSAAVNELPRAQRLATMIKTILSSLPRAVIIILKTVTK